jgi:GT2 family glycosyltransferase
MKYTNRQEIGFSHLFTLDNIDLSIVIVTWNVVNLLEKCIESILLNLDGLSLEIFVVDNASTDNTLQMLHERFPNVQIIANEKNIGFARANNQALRRVKGRFVLVLNPDTVLTDGALTKMINFMTDHPEVGVVGPYLCYPTAEVQEPCARLLPTLTSILLYEVLQIYKLPLIGKWLVKKYIFPYDYHVTQEVEAVSGAAMVLRREVVEVIDGFGESFIHCGEDIDLCFRVRKAGWKISYLCDAAVIHFSGQSSRQAPVRTFVNAALSIHEYFNRCYGINQGILYRFIVQVIQIPMLISVGFIKILLGFESNQEFKRRLEIAKAIWLWRVLE